MGVNEDSSDITSKCIKPTKVIYIITPPNAPKPNPNSKCNALMVNIDPLDMTSKCVPINVVTPPNTPKPNPNSKCVQPMVNEAPEDMKSACVPPFEAKPNPNSKCTPPKVNRNPLDMTSKCVPIPAVIYVITPPNTIKPN